MSNRRVTKRIYAQPPFPRRAKASAGLKMLTLGIFIAFSLLMTSGTAYLYMAGMEPWQFYLNLANPAKRYVSIPAGLRREQVAERFQKVLSWDDKEVQAFMETAPSDDERNFLDGYYMPGSYWVSTEDTGPDVAHQMLRNFNDKVSEKILSKTLAKGKAGAFQQKVNLDTAVRIASIIQREAGGSYDMKIISGVIWNRMFRGMTLDMDATLQYAKASSTNWWPRVKGEDKYIDSPFNTYQNKGLPPTAIANPSLAAIEAAFNPAKTDCIFYLHDDDGGFHCEQTYAAHKANVQKYLIGKR